MKKRFLSLALSLSLAVSLAAPAFAAEPTAEEAVGTMLELGVLASEEPGIMEWEEFVQQYLTDHPEYLEELDTDAWFADNYYFWEKEEYMDLFGIETEEEFQDEIRREYINRLLYEYDYGLENPLFVEVKDAYMEYLEEYYEARHPGALAQLDVQELLANQGYDKDLTPMEQYMEDHYLSSEEEVRDHLVQDYIQSRVWVEENLHQEFLSVREEYPDRWAEFDADAYFAESYSEEKEEYLRYWYVYTEEEFAETMFVGYVRENRWEWEFEPNEWNDWGEDALTLVVNGFPREGSGITAMEGVSYLPAEEVNAILGTDYAGEEPVSLRAAAQAAGWDVVWNPYCSQVVLLDRETLMSGIYIPEGYMPADEEDGYLELLSLLGEREGELFRQDFSKFDELITRMSAETRPQEGESVHTTGTVDMTFTAFNSLDGDESYDVTVTTDVLVQGNILDITITANAAQLLDMLGQPVLNKLAQEMPKYTFQDLKNLLTGCKAEVILNIEEGRLYWNVPLLALLDDTASADTWYSMELPVTDMPELDEALAVEPGEWNTALWLYRKLVSDSATDYWGADVAYAEYAATRTAMNLLVGGDAVAEKNGKLTWTLNAQGLDEMLRLTQEEPVGRFFKELDISVSVDRDGKRELSAAIRPDMEGLAEEFGSSPYSSVGSVVLMDWVLGLLDFRYTTQASGSARGMTGETELHWKNQFKLEAKSSSRLKYEKKAPRTAPPDGAEIVEL